MEVIGAVLFAIAIAHTFATKFFERLARHHPRHAGLFHLLGEVEVVFGFWATVLIMVMATVQGAGQAIEYAEARQYTEPLFVFVIMVVAASRPVLETIKALVSALARLVPLRMTVAQTWLCLAVVPLIGSLITEPAAMTMSALMLAPLVFRPGIPEPLKYAALGVLFVNISVGGTLTSFAAPPVLMVAGTWNWDSVFMAANFGWKACIAVIINATAITLLLRKHLHIAEPASKESTTPKELRVPPIVSAIHLAFLMAVVALAHHPVLFLGVFLLFLGFAQAYERYQTQLILKEALLVGFFLAGLVVLGALQRWWLEPIVSGLQPTALFFGALGLTAITDNACAPQLFHPVGLAMTRAPAERRGTMSHGQPPEDRKSSRRRRLAMGVAPVSVCRDAPHRESLPAPAAGSVHRARYPTAPGRRGYPHQPGATGTALRLARRAGGGATGDDDPLASHGLEIALANEVPDWSAADPEGTARADP